MSHGSERSGEPVHDLSFEWATRGDIRGMRVAFAPSRRAAQCRAERLRESSARPAGQVLLSQYEEHAARREVEARVAELEALLRVWRD